MQKPSHNGERPACGAFVSREPASFVDALNEVARRTIDKEAEINAALDQLTVEEAQTVQAIDEAHRRIEALRARRSALEDRRAALSADRYRAEQGAVRAGLRADRDRLMQRAALGREAAAARNAAIAAELRAPELAAAMQETERFQAEVEASLSTLPPSYRRAALENHERNVRRLAPYAAALNCVTPTLNAEVEAIAVVACASPAEGRPEALVLVLPVPFSVYSDWSTRPEDLASMLAYRMVSALHRLLGDLGTPNAMVEYVEVHGCLAVQAWLADHEVTGDLQERTLEHIGRAYEDSVELVNAAIEVHAAWIRPELLTLDVD